MTPIASRPRIDADAPAAPAARRRGQLVEAELTRAVIGAFYDVYNVLGFGFLESVYARAMERELVTRGLSVVREAPIAVRYRDVVVGLFRADLLVASRLIVELKSSVQIAATDRRQLLNYLTASDVEVGLLLHFGPRPTFHRLVATNPRPSPLDRI